MAGVVLIKAYLNSLRIDHEFVKSPEKGCNTNRHYDRLSTENLFNLFFDGETFLTFLFFWKTFLNLFFYENFFFQDFCGKCINFCFFWVDF